MTVNELHDQFILAFPLDCKSFHDLSDHFYDNLYQKMHATPFVSTQHYKFLLPDDASDKGDKKRESIRSLYQLHG